VSVTALRDDRTSIIGYLLIGTDNTARKEVEAAQALIDQHQRLVDQQFYTRSVIDSSIDGIMMTDPQGLISDVNEQMVVLTGRARTELIGSPCKIFFTEPLRADEAIKQTLTENRVSDYELTVRASDGQETVVSWNAATFRDRDGKVKGVVVSARDVTERKRFERALQDKNILLEHASLMKSEFLATMSHELRTPLNAIIGFSEALKEGLAGAMSDIQYEYTGDIFTSGQHLLSLINDILDLSKVEAGMMTLELEPVELDILFSNSLSIVREKAISQRIELTLDMDDNLGIAQLDLRKTKQIIYNLLSNAVKFSSNGGKVTLSARQTTLSEVGTLPGTWPVYNFPLLNNEYEDFLEICVSDDGIGIAQADMNKLFLAFSQIDSSLARKFEGTGLGLAMVKQLADLQGGSVAVASEEGQGSRFAVWLPLRTQSQVALMEEQAENIPVTPEVPAQERKVILLEDVKGSGDVVSALLKEEGFMVLRPASVDAAVGLALQHTFSLIIMCQDDPDNGIWFSVEKLRENRDLVHVPAIIIAGKNESRMALIGGTAAILQKPVKRVELLAALAHLRLEASNERTCTVLVVDDDRKSIEVIAAFLPSPEYAVIRVHGGQEAITLAGRLLPDLIFLDLMMPDVTGFDVVEALQRNPMTTHIPILVQTAKKMLAEDHVILRSNPAKNVHLIKKSDFSRANFIEQIRHAMSVSQEHSSNG
jgi:PAS domain S-box-containing protein